jgi:hypothetical protein
MNVLRNLFQRPDPPEKWYDITAQYDVPSKTLILQGKKKGGVPQEILRYTLRDDSRGTLDSVSAYARWTPVTYYYYYLFDDIAFEISPPESVSPFTYKISVHPVVPGQAYRQYGPPIVYGNISEERQRDTLNTIQEFARDNRDPNYTIEKFSFINTPSGGKEYYYEVPYAELLTARPRHPSELYPPPPPLRNRLQNLAPSAPPPDPRYVTPSAPPPDPRYVAPSAPPAPLLHRSNTGDPTPLVEGGKKKKKRTLRRKRVSRKKPTKLSRRRKFTHSK